MSIRMSQKKNKKLKYIVSKSLRKEFPYCRFCVNYRTFSPIPQFLAFDHCFEKKKKTLSVQALAEDVYTINIMMVRYVDM